MDLKLRGWGRNCGDNVLMSGNIAKGDIVKKIDSLNTGKIYVLPGGFPTKDGAAHSEINLYFDTNLVLNGHYLGQLTVRKHEIDRLFILMNGDVNWIDLLKRQSSFIND